MKLLILFFLFPLLSFGAKKSVIVTYKYKRSSQATEKSLSFEELKWIYTLTKQQTPYFPPSPKQFFNDYLRFKLGVEAALHDKALVATPSIEKSIVSPFLKASFHQELYKSFAELKLKKQVKRLEKTTRNLSESQLRSLYRKDSQYNFFYISIFHPLKPTPAQQKEAKVRANKVYSQVKNSKKSFTDLVTLTSDEKYNGLLNWNRTRASIAPQVYAVIQKMKAGSISKPIKVPTGYLIVKLNRKVPFDKKIHEKPLKENFFAERKTRALNNYMNNLKKQFKISIVNRRLIQSLK